MEMASYNLHGNHGRFTSISMGSLSARAQFNAASIGPAHTMCTKPTKQ